MRFSDSTQFHNPEPIKYANSDSPPFNSDDTASDKASQKPMTPLDTTNYKCPTSSSNLGIFFLKLLPQTHLSNSLTTHLSDR